jgi:protein-tyrosine-phosphatase
MGSVLFVCTANRCRSPMAEYLFRERMAYEEPAWRIESAGTWAADGDPAMPRTEAVLAEVGLDASGHRSRSVDRCDLASFDLILVMEAGHREALSVEFPEVASRIYLLSEMVGKKFDVRDPVAGTTEDYRQTLREIRSLLAQGEGRIRDLVAKRA